MECMELINNKLKQKEVIYENPFQPFGFFFVFLLG